MHQTAGYVNPFPIQPRPVPQQAPTARSRGSRAFQAPRNKGHENAALRPSLPDRCRVPAATHRAPRVLYCAPRPCARPTLSPEPLSGPRRLHPLQTAPTRVARVRSPPRRARVLQRPLTSAACAPRLARGPLPWHAGPPAGAEARECPPNPTSGSSGTRPSRGPLRLTVAKAALPGRDSGGTEVRSRCSAGKH